MPITVKGFIVGTKVWRKLHTWLVFATQDFSDFSEDALQDFVPGGVLVFAFNGSQEARRLHNSAI